MVQRGKRKAQASAPSPKSSQPKKKINLNRSVVYTPKRGRPRKADQQSATISNVHQSDNINSINQSKPAASTIKNSRFSLPTFTIPNFGFTSSSTSLNEIVESTSRLNRWVKDLVPEVQNYRMIGRGKNRDPKGKGKQSKVDEQDHLSAQESAQMIELLDTPVSVKKLYRRDLNNGAAEEYHSDDLPEGLLEDEDKMPISIAERSQIPSSEEEEEVKHVNGNMEESTDPSPFLEDGQVNGEVHSSAEDEHKVAYDEPSNGNEEVEVEKAEESKEKKLEVTNEFQQGAQADMISTIMEDVVLPSHPHEGKGEDKVLVEETNGVKEEEDTTSIPEIHTERNDQEDGQIEADETRWNQIDQVVIEGEHKPEENQQQIEPNSEDEEEILIPTSGHSAREGVIDLTESRSSSSPEPDLQPEEAEDETILVAAPPPIPPRQKPSGFFSNGTLAQEKRQQESQSPSQIIQQLGRLQFESARTPSKVLRKASTGFRKKDPIFSQARKSMALGIAHSKVDNLLNSLKGHVKKTLCTPFIDDMLKKRVALARMLDDDSPEDEIQIRHLREILKRSTFSLRPARRLLKEQERLAHEEKLLRKRALGILARQPLPSSLADADEEFVKQTNQKQGKIAQMVGAGVESRDIARLKPSKWLNDEVINFYTKLILKRSDEAVQKRATGRLAKKRLGQACYSSEEDRIKDIATVKEVKRYWNGIWNVWTFTSFFWEKLTSGGYSGVRAWTRKVDIFTKDLILLPINMGQMHWVCAAINMRRCRFEYYDSLHERNSSVFKILVDYLQAEYADKKKESAGPLLLNGWKNYCSQQSPSQSNGFDCGVFASMTLEQISRRSPADGDLKDELNVEIIVQKSKELAEQKGSAEEEEEEEEEWNFSQANMPYLRRRMVLEIAKTKLMDE